MNGPSLRDVLAAWAAGLVGGAAAAALSPGPPLALIAAVSVLAGTLAALAVGELRQPLASVGHSTPPGSIPDPPGPYATPASVAPPAEAGRLESVRGPVDLGRYRGTGDARRLPQCPRCGDFDVSVHAGTRTIFACRRCTLRWAWVPGQPWPSVRIDARAQPQHQTV